MNLNSLFPQLPVRLRLTAWYLLTLALILFLSGLILFLQIRRSLLSQIDTSLQLAAAQAAVNIDRDNDQLAFQNIENLSTQSRQFSDDIVLFLLSPDGDVWGTLGQGNTIRPFPITPGYLTSRRADDNWRVYSEPIADADHTVLGWLQIAQSLEPTRELLDALQLQLLWGIPLALLFAGVGGYLVALRALAPIERITRTGQAITASDLSQRIDYIGPADEIGRLAATFDGMLDRLEVGFARERRFTGDAAHELRTPLTALKGRIEVALNQPRRPAEYVETLRDMQYQVDRLVSLSSDLLYMARLEQGHFEPIRDTVELADLLGAVVDQVQARADSKNITIVVAVPPGIEIQGMLDMLIRLFLNLLDNAVKYTPAGGEISVNAELCKSDIAVSVRNSGPGIPPEHLPHLFERFYRADSARAWDGSADNQGGVGLGLAIAHEIAKAHGGSLTVQSSPMQATIFTAHFPRTT